MGADSKTFHAREGKAVSYEILYPSHSFLQGQQDKYPRCHLFHLLCVHALSYVKNMTIVQSL